jgi:D-glycero-alpha-D-manno-heptose-7-phosphate kinase
MAHIDETFLTKRYRGFCRVDWVGGTTDMWPLYCHMDHARVINMATSITMNVEISLEKSAKFSLSIFSKDLSKKSQHKSFADLNKDILKSSKQNPLRWVQRVVTRAMEIAKVETGAWSIVTQSDAPPGSGLGGSSVLGVTLAKAVFDFAGLNMDPWDLHQMVYSLESAEIEKPAGEQDYIPALFGGFLSFNLNAHSKVVSHYPAELGVELASRSALIHTGKPHHSGINNWDVFKKFHEGNKSVRKALFDVRDLAEEMHEYLLKGNVEAFVKAINKEWAFRKKLSKTFDAPVLQQAWNFAKKEGAIARKACGAGGGGSLLVVFKNSEARDDALLVKPPKNWIWLPLDLEEQGLYPS